MWGTHIFVLFAVIYESPNKSTFAEKLERNLKVVKTKIPANYEWSMDHMKPTGTKHSAMTADDFATMIHKLRSVKASEVTCGVRIERDDPILQDGDKLAAYIEEVYTTLLPLYRLSF
jgi:uncharacterized protein YktB (UPF0637 family)